MSDIVLLTGATGFVGRQVLRELSMQNKVIRLIVREGRVAPVDPSMKIDKVIRTQDLFAEPVNWWTDACKDVDTVVHVAWYAEHGKYLLSRNNLDCLTGTLKLAEGAVLSGVRRFVGIGTCFEYDMSCGMLTTKTPLKPLTLYAAAKAAVYFNLSQYLRTKGIEFAWCRLFYLYGEGEDARRLVPYIHSRLSSGEDVFLTSGTQIRDFLDVKEAASLIATVALGNVHGAVNVCSGIPISVRQLAEEIAEKYDRQDLLKFGARPDNIVDPPYVVGVPFQ
jgi:dTDP-6-deoxy-L-talose 4-dehydrogenase (NAD+)